VDPLYVHGTQVSNKHSVVTNDGHATLS